MGGMNRHGHRHILVLAWLLIAIMLGGCKTEYVYIPARSTMDSLSARYVRDSVIVRDSVYVHQWHERDTTWVEKVTVHTRYRDRWRVDTIITYRRDSVPYPVEVAKEVVKYQLRWWQKPLVWLGGLSILGLAVWWLVRARKR